MPTPSVAHVAVAKRLLAHDRAGAEPVLDDAANVGRVFGCLYRTLEPLIGEAGAHALFVRSLKLSRVEFPELAKVAGPGEPSCGSQNGVADVVARLCQLHPNTCMEAAIALLAVVLGLLTNFIGDPLVRQILQKAFPSIYSVQAKESV